MVMRCVLQFSFKLADMDMYDYAEVSSAWE